MKNSLIDHTDGLRYFSSKERKKAKELLEFAKSLNRPVKFIGKGVSMDWEKTRQKINQKKY